MFSIFSKKKVAHNKNELVGFIKEAVSKNGDCCDLNFIDVSRVKDMGALFKGSSFNGDISKWDVSNVLLMDSMFEDSVFNGDISKWNVSNVNVMSGMFAHSKFDGDISQWNVRSVNDMSAMFRGSVFNGDISNWNVSNVETMRDMFKESKYTGNISQWNVSKVQNMESMFAGSSFNGDISNWNVSSCKLFGDMFANSSFSGEISKWSMPESERSRLWRNENESSKSMRRGLSLNDDDTLICEPDGYKMKCSGKQKPFSARKNWMDSPLMNSVADVGSSKATVAPNEDPEILRLEQQLRENYCNMSALDIKEIKDKIAEIRRAREEIEWESRRSGHEIQRNIVRKQT